MAKADTAKFSIEIPHLTVGVVLMIKSAWEESHIIFNMNILFLVPRLVSTGPAQASLLGTASYVLCTIVDRLRLANLLCYLG